MLINLFVLHIHVVNVIKHSRSSQCGVDNKKLMSAYILKSEEQTLYEYIVRVCTIMRYLIKMIDHSVESENINNNIYHKVAVQHYYKCKIILIE